MSKKLQGGVLFKDMKEGFPEGQYHLRHVCDGAKSTGDAGACRVEKARRGAETFLNRR